MADEAKLLRAIEEALRLLEINTYAAMQRARVVLVKAATGRVVAPHGTAWDDT